MIASRSGYTLLLLSSLCGFRVAYSQQSSGSSQAPQTGGRRGSSANTSSTPSSANPDTSAAVSTIELSGRVLDARNRQPIARALVRFGSRAVLTDHDGVFHFPDVVSSPTSSQGFTLSRSSGTYAFTVSKPGFYSSADGDAGQSQAFRFAADAPIELPLYPEAILAGTVANASGESLAHLSVVARRSIFDENGHHWYPAGQTQTANDGSFRLPVPAGVYSVSISPRGRPSGGTEVVLPVSVPAITSSLAEALHLHPGEEIHVDLRPETRKAYQVTLNFTPDGGGFGGFPALTARTANGISMPLSPIPSRGDNRGELRVALPTGSYTLIGSMQGQDGVSEAQAQVTVADHDIAGIALRFARAPSLPVVVEADSSATSDNVKVPDAIQLGLFLQPTSDNPDGNGQMYRVESRRNAAPAFSVPYGSYRLRGQPGGQWFITAASCGGVDLLTQDLPVSPGLNGTEVRVRVSNKTANLSGTVTLDGVPAAAWVYLLATTPSATPVVILRAGTDGTFYRPYMASGSYRAVALESKIGADFQSAATQNQLLDRLQSFSVAAGEQRILNLVAVPQRELPQ